MNNITIITNPAKSWWPGDRRVDPYMKPVVEVLDKHFGTKLPHNKDWINIYNTAYEAVYNAIKDRE